ncbi:MAG: phage holin family protein [Desulfobacteraceae bacterium]|nr:phage holin family protein [Desulfobacteraceae bacterium]
MRHIRITRYENNLSSFGQGMMARLFIKWLCLTGAVWFAALAVDGISVTGFASAFFAAAAIGFLNMVFRPILLILTLPINVLSFGLFTFVINAFILKMATVIPGFTVNGFWAAVFGSLFISIANWVLTLMIGEKRMYSYSGMPHPGNGGVGNGAEDAPKDTIDLNKRNDKWQ